MTSHPFCTECLVDGWSQQIRVDKVLSVVQSQYQKLCVAENASLGRVLVIDDRVQLTTLDEFAYHEMAAHVPIVGHGNVKNVLIIGGGDGGTMREVLRHENVHVTLVDIDEEIIKISKEFLPSLHEGAFDNPRATIVIGDGTRFVEETENRYDVIIIDPEEDGPSSVLFKSKFYSDCKCRLNDGGILVAMFGHPQFEEYPQTALSNLSAVFPVVSGYTLCIPTYLGGLQLWAWGATDRAAIDTPIDILNRRWANSGITTCRYYTPEVGKASFVLPKWLHEKVISATARPT